MVVAKHQMVEMVGQVQASEALPSEEQCRKHDNLVRSILENVIPSHIIIINTLLFSRQNSRSPKRQTN